MIETPLLTKKRIIESLKEGKRLDGRSNDAFWNFTIETGISKNAEGSARIKIGDTEVIVGVKMDIAEPFPDSADEGILITTAELLPLSSPRYESGPPKFEAISYGRLVDRAIRESNVIDFKKMCIKEGEKVWMIFIDLYPLNDDGNLLDAFTLGALAALKNARLPVYDEKTYKVSYGEWSQKKIPMNMESMPLLLTVYKAVDSFFVDPTKEEEDSSDTNMMLAISDADGPTIHALQKNGEESLSNEMFEELLNFVEKIWKKMYPKILKDIENINSK